MVFLARAAAAVVDCVFMPSGGAAGPCCHSDRKLVAFFSTLGGAQDHVA